MMNLVEFTDWRFPNQRNRYKGNLDLNSNNEGKLQLYGDAHLELDFESYQKSLTSCCTYTDRLHF